MKGAGIVTGSVLIAGCAPGISRALTQTATPGYMETPEAPVTKTATKPPENEGGTESGKTFEGRIDKSQSPQIQKDFLDHFVGVKQTGVDQTNTTGFSINALGQRADLVLKYVPTLIPCKSIFIKTTNGWAQMAQVPINKPPEEVFIGMKKEKRSYTGWALQLVDRSFTEPVITQIQLNPGDWENMLADQKKNYSLDFNPPPDLRPNYKGFDPKKGDRIVVKEVQGVSNIAAMPVEVKTSIEYKRTQRVEDFESAQRISLENIKSGSLAQWAIEQVKNKVIAPDPSKLYYYTEPLKSSGQYSLSAESTDRKGYNAKNAVFVGFFKINPSEFGLKGKNDAVVLVSVMEDKNRNRVAQIGIDSLSDVQLYGTGTIVDPNRECLLLDSISLAWTPNVLKPKSAKVGGPDDLNDLARNDQLLVAQNITRKIVDDNFIATAKNGVFYDPKTGFDQRDFYNKTAFFIVIGAPTN